ncbi:protein arginine N-methyltransferase 7 isoform X2 [Cephus cinctus]|nr:protein arginine N-methyltransferase 7 isoform X2 [Cephus cinctus]
MKVGPNGDMTKRANILVTEVFDTELIGEGALSTFHHAQQVLLEKDSIIVPSRGTVWAQVVESSMVCAWNRVQPLSHGDDKKVLIDAPTSIKTCSGVSAVHDLQLTYLPQSSFRPLLPPLPIFRFNWSGATPLKFNESVSICAKSIASGVAHAVFMWWELDMDMDGQVLLSCAPVWEHPESKLSKNLSLDQLADRIPWRDHWMQAVYYLPVAKSVTVGDEITLVGSHDEYSLWFQLKDETKIKEKVGERPICECCVHVAFSRTRIGQLNDEERNRKFIKAIKKMIKPNKVCVSLSDGSLIGLTAAKLGAKKVVVLEPNSLSRRTTEMFIKANNLSEKVQIIDTPEQLPSAEEVDLIVGEPYFVTSILPWYNLRFWYLASKYPSNIPRIPTAAKILGVAVEFKDLHKIRAPLGICEGFDMSAFDKLVQDSSDISDSPVEAHPLWEYPAKALGSPFVLASFDLTQDVNLYKPTEFLDSVAISSKGSCNGVALWVDWYLDSNVIVSSGPVKKIQPGSRISWDPYTRQGVYLLRKINEVTEQDTLSWSLKFYPADGTMQFHFNTVRKH